MMSAICCGVSLFWSPQAGIVNCGLLPLGVEPCSMNRSRLKANTAGSPLAMVESIGLSTGTVPSSEPGLFTPPVPCGPWHFTQLVAKRDWPVVGLPVRFSAWPGPPGLEGRAICGAAWVTAGVPPVGVGPALVAATVAAGVPPVGVALMVTVTAAVGAAAVVVTGTAGFRLIT